MKHVEKRMEFVSLDKINFNPANWKKHGRKQREFLQSVFREIGFITPVIWNEQTGNLIDGHLRVSEVRATGTTEIEALIVNLDETEELKVLSLLDKVGAMGDEDSDRYESLIKQIVFDDEFLESQLRQVEEEITKLETAEYEIVPEMLKNYQYLLLVFKNETNFMSAKDLFGVDYMLDRYNSKKGVSMVVDGDAYVEEVRS